VLLQNVSPSTSVRSVTQLSLPPTDKPSVGVPSLIDEAWRLEPFVPPFAFSAFFSPEDTLLCVCAAEAATDLLTEAEPSKAGDYSFAELTSGSGLVGFYLLQRALRTRLLGLDIDPEATAVSERNARVLGLAERARFTGADLWSESTRALLEKDRPDLLVCNPPYVPEPPGTRMHIEAGAGPHGTAHLLQALELARLVQPAALALSWCSLSAPAAIVGAAEESGYELHNLFVTAIADGEYSGSVHSYLRNLGDCYINEQRDTLDIIASDGSGRFAYLLFAGAFRREVEPRRNGADVEAICRKFAREGVRSLASIDAPFPVHCSMLTRWDELELRVMLHGAIGRPTREPV